MDTTEADKLLIQALPWLHDCYADLLHEARQEQTASRRRRSERERDACGEVIRRVEAHLAERKKVATAIAGAGDRLGEVSGRPTPWPSI